MSWEDQGRQEHGWFGHGTSSELKPDQQDDSGGLFGTARLADRAASVAHGAIGAVPRGLRGLGAAKFDALRLAQLNAVIRMWASQPERVGGAFAEEAAGRDPADPVVIDLSRLAHATAEAKDHAALRDASTALASVMLKVGIYKWPGELAMLAKRAEAMPSPATGTAPVMKAQELLLTPKIPPIFEEEVPEGVPPRSLAPRNMERIPGQSGKESARDIPSWAKGKPRWVGETPRDYAKRLMDDKFGPGRWKQEDPEFSKIQKWGSRAYRDPKVELPATEDDSKHA